MRAADPVVVIDRIDSRQSNRSWRANSHREIESNVRRSVVVRAKRRDL
jgi:hypothetical protein